MSKRRPYAAEAQTDERELRAILRAFADRIELAVDECEDAEELGERLGDIVLEMLAYE